MNSELSNFRNLCVARHRLTPHPDMKYAGTPGLIDALRLYLSNLLSSGTIYSLIKSDTENEKNKREQSEV